MQQRRLVLVLAVQADFINYAWRYDHACYGFVRLERTAAVDVLTLVIAFFGLTRYVSAAFGVSSSLAKRAMHHGEPTLNKRNRDDVCILITKLAFAN